MRLFSFAFAPRTTMARTEHSHLAIIALVAAAFVSSTLRSTDARAIREKTTLAVVIGVVLVSAVICAAIFYLFAWIATIVGHWLGGTGHVDRVRVALAWGFAPIIIALAYRVPALLFWPDAVAAVGGKARHLTIGGPGVDLTLPAINAPLYQVAILALLHLAFTIWYLIVASQTLAEAQGFSPWRGLANLMLAFVLPVVALFVIAVAAFLAY